MRIIALISLFFLISTHLSAQSVFDGLGAQTQVTNATELVEERIDKISLSRRIFVITNRNSSFGRGDFVSLLINNELVARALVAKLTADGLAGIKIVKIYSMDQWNFLREGLTVQVLRGDDSYYQNLRNQPENADELTLIKEEEDLFNSSTFLEDDLLLDEKTNRILKNDNILSVFLSSIEGVDNAGQSASYRQFNASYAYQLDDNIFVEASYGRNLINDFPAGGIDTLLQNISIKGSYVFKGPYFSFFLPYIGYQFMSASSDDAGQGVGAAQAQRELDLVDELKQNRPIFGVTALKRLVPGWFIRASIGNDALGAGLALEF